jgi:hypothetical protein
VSDKSKVSSNEPFIHVASDKSQITFYPLESGGLPALMILLTAGVILAGFECATENYRSAAVVAMAALAAAFFVYASISVERLLLVWFALTPVAAFFARYPTDRSILTFDRAMFLLFAVMSLSRWTQKTAGKQEARARSESPARFTDLTASEWQCFSLSTFELTWAALSILALVSSIVTSKNLAPAARVAVDTFWLPLVAFHLGKNYFDVRRSGNALLLVCMVLALFLFAVGAVELATGIDLFHYKGSELMREGERRINGPFATDSSYSIICLMLFLFLLAAPGLLRARFDRTARVIYIAALASSAFGALLPLFRAIAIALIACFILLIWLTRDTRRPSRVNRSRLEARLSPASAAPVILVAVVVAAFLIAPMLGVTRLTESRTAFGRFATWQAAAEIALANPVFGVGLGNYADYFDQTHYYSDEAVEEIMEARAVDSPHSNLLWVAAELGLFGLALYLFANACLFIMGWRAFKRAANSKQRTAAACFVVLIVAYWIPGSTLTSGYYSDLNLFFFFLVGVLAGSFKYFARSAAPALS